VVSLQLRLFELHKDAINDFLNEFEEEGKIFHLENGGILLRR